MGRRALIISIVINVVLLASVIGLVYGWPLFLHVKELLPKRERHVSFFATFPVQKSDIVFVGDGLTEEGRWDELFPEMSVKNRGVARDTTEDVALRIGQISAGKPRKIFLMIGSRDAAAEKSVVETGADYQAILDRIRAESPGSEVYVQSILPRSAEERETIEARNREIRRIAAEADVPFIDLFPAFLGPEGAIRPNLSNDDKHLLGTGYEIWRDAVAPYVGEPQERPSVRPVTDENPRKDGEAGSGAALESPPPS